MKDEMNGPLFAREKKPIAIDQQTGVVLPGQGVEGGVDFVKDGWNSVTIDGVQLPPQPRRPLLVGECNPYGGDPKFALYPLPEHSAGGRLCSIIFGLQRTQYLRKFDRVNLCVGKWSMKEARARAADIEKRANPAVSGSLTLVLLGRKVAQAFNSDHVPPFSVVRAGGVVAAIIPHPSGLCREWNEPGAIERARQTLLDAGITL